MGRLLLNGDKKLLSKIENSKYDIEYPEDIPYTDGFCGVYGIYVDKKLVYLSSTTTLRKTIHSIINHLIDNDINEWNYALLRALMEHEGSKLTFKIYLIARGTYAEQAIVATEAAALRDYIPLINNVAKAMNYVE